MPNATASNVTTFRSIRTHLLGSFALLALLIVAVVGVSLLGFAQIRQRTTQTIKGDGQLSRLADSVAIQALLCRRYEKDLLLNIGDAEQQRKYLAQWQTAWTELDQAIAAFGTAATITAERQQARAWQADAQQYRQAVEQVVRGIESGQITTPQAANAALAPAKEPIRSLSDGAVEVATQRNQAVQAADARLIATNRASSTTVLALGVIAAIVAIVWSLVVPTRLMTPISALHNATQRFAAGAFDTRIEMARRDELGALADSFNAMARTIEQRSASLEAERAAAEDARQAAVEAHSHVAEQLVTIERQQDVIREMSVPVLPLSPHVLVMPLVGALDTARLTLIQQQALESIEAARARFLILDITGVPVIDTQVAQGFIQVVQAARLLGAEILLVGIRPEVAQTVIGLGIQLSMITTFSSLYEGVEYTRRTPRPVHQLRSR